MKYTSAQNWFIQNVPARGSEPLSSPAPVGQSAGIWRVVAGKMYVRALDLSICTATSDLRADQLTIFFWGGGLFQVSRGFFLKPFGLQGFLSFTV